MPTQPAKQPSRKRDPDVRSSVESIQPRARALSQAEPGGPGGSAAEWVKPSALKPWPQNPTKDDPASVRRVAESIKRFGFGAPLVARRANGEVIAGHTRLRAAKQLGLELVPVRYLDISEKDAHILALADNRLAELTLRNNAELAELLKAMEPSDQLLAGYTGGDVQALLREAEGEPEIVEDEVPAPPKVPVTKLGDVWLLGRHRLVCGDCRAAGGLVPATGGASVNLAFTSPPYASQRAYDESSGFEPIDPDHYVEWFESVQRNVRAVLAADGSWFVNIKPHSDGLDTGLYVLDLVVAHVRRWGWHFATEYCWARQGFPGKPARRFKNQFEPIYQFALNEWKFRPGAVTHASDRVPTYDRANHWANGLNDSTAGRAGNDWAAVSDGDAYPGNMLPVGAKPNAGGHVAAFPVGLPTFFIRAYTDPSDTVLDPFIGSGTTLIAAEQLDRRCIGIELSPAYCDVVVERWQHLTGGRAERESS